MDNKKRNFLLFSLFLISVFLTYSFVQAEDQDNIDSNLDNKKCDCRCDFNFKEKTNSLSSTTIKFDREQIEKVQEAIQNQDYDAWITAEGSDSKIAEKITKENFSRFIEMHELLKNKNFDEAKIIAEELGIDFGHKKPERLDGIKNNQHNFKDFKNKSEK
ncbi:MAG: hypothetical protein WC414_01525 [Patescibacteria group bacterium]